MNVKGGKEKPSEAKRRANAENAKKPRPRMDEDVRAIAKEKLTGAFIGPGLDRVRAIITGERVSNHEEFRWAMEFYSNRLGLPVTTQQDVSMSGSVGWREVTAVEGGLGWPGVTGGADDPPAARGDHDGRPQHAIQ